MVLRNQLAERLILYTRLSLSLATYSMVFHYQLFIAYRWPYNPKRSVPLRSSWFMVIGSQSKMNLFFYEL
jgi:hypothetical protein